MLAAVSLATTTEATLTEPRQQTRSTHRDITPSWANRLRVGAGELCSLRLKPFDGPLIAFRTATVRPGCEPRLEGNTGLKIGWGRSR